MQQTLRLIKKKKCERFCVLSSVLCAVGIFLTATEPITTVGGCFHVFTTKIGLHDVITKWMA